MPKWVCKILQGLKQTASILAESLAAVTGGLIDGVLKPLGLDGSFISKVLTVGALAAGAYFLLPILGRKNNSSTSSESVRFTTLSDPDKQKFVDRIREEGVAVDSPEARKIMVDVARSSEAAGRSFSELSLAEQRRVVAMASAKGLSSSDPGFSEIVKQVAQGGLNG